MTVPSDVMSFGQFMSILDSSACRLRCPWCGKFRKLEDFPKQRTGARIPGGYVDWGMACVKCREKG